MNDDAPRSPEKSNSDDAILEDRADEPRGASQNSSPLTGADASGAPSSKEDSDAEDSLKADSPDQASAPTEGSTRESVVDSSAVWLVQSIQIVRPMVHDQDTSPFSGVRVGDGNARQSEASEGQDSSVVNDPNHDAAVDDSAASVEVVSPGSVADSGLDRASVPTASASPENRDAGPVAPPEGLAVTSSNPARAVVASEAAVIRDQRSNRSGRPVPDRHSSSDARAPRSRTQRHPIGREAVGVVVLVVLALVCAALLTAVVIKGNNEAAAAAREAAAYTPPPLVTATPVPSPTPTPTPTSTRTSKPR